MAGASAAGDDELLPAWLNRADLRLHPLFSAVVGVLQVKAGLDDAGRRLAAGLTSAAEGPGATTWANAARQHVEHLQSIRGEVVKAQAGFGRAISAGVAAAQQQLAAREAGLVSAAASLLGARITKVLWEGRPILLCGQLGRIWERCRVDARRAYHQGTPLASYWEGRPRPRSWPAGQNLL